MMKVALKAMVTVMRMMDASKAVDIQSRREGKGYGRRSVIEHFSYVVGKMCGRL